MSSRLATLAALAVVVLVATGGVALLVRPAAVVPPVAPRLAVVVVVDQMRFDYLERFRPLFTGGLRAFVSRGAVFTNARYRHACTETGPGHATLLTGRSPRSSGIVGNGWFDRTLRRRVTVVEDETVRLTDGAAGDPASPAHLLGATVGDVLKARSPRSRVVSLSLKDRAAVLMGGQRADAAYWFEKLAGGRFVTSTHYMPVTPPWLEGWNKRRLFDTYAGRSWERLQPDRTLYEKHAGVDAVEGEWDRKDTTFPHVIRERPPAPDYYEDVRRTPYADVILLDLALAAAEAHRLGEDEDTDLLAVSFSACDAIGHTYGPDSQEMLDEMLRLDRVLGQFLEAVERRAGPGRALIVLTADHGVMPLVEHLLARGLPARRVRGEVLTGAVAQALAARFPGKSGLLADADASEYVLDTAAITRQGVSRAEVESTIRQALLATGLVDAVYSAAELVGGEPAGDPFYSLYQRAFFAPRSGDLLARVKPYIYVNDHVGGTGHGSPYDYDRHVPIVFLGPGIAPGPRDVACGPEDIAWTFARLLGLSFPQQDADTDLLPHLRPRP